MTSGQVFRWERQADGGWLGIDGDYWYQVAPEVEVTGGIGSLSVQSNGTAHDFEQVFRLDWDADLIASEISEVAPELAPIIAELSGLRVMRPSCSTEIFFCFLCTPNNNLTRIVQMARHLATHGPVLDVIDNLPIHRFPDAETIAQIPEADLRAKAFGYRAATIPRAAGQVVERGPGWIESLKHISYQEAHAELCQIKGIGPKLADCIALFALHHTEAIPIDTHIWQAYTRLYRPEWKDKALTDARYKEAAEFLRSRFGIHGGWAQQYLFYENMMNWRKREE